MANTGTAGTGSGRSSRRASRWVEQLDRLVVLKTQIVLHGSIYDRVPLNLDPEEGKSEVTFVALKDFLHEYFSRRGYQIVGFYDVVDGLHFLDDGERARFDELREAQPREKWGNATRETDNDPRDPSRNLAAVRTVVRNDRYPVVVVLDFASRLLTDPERLHPDERSNFIRLVKCAQDATRVRAGDQTCNNLTVLICDKLNDLPTWMFLNNPLVSSVQIDLPDEGERRHFFETYLHTFHGVGTSNDSEEVIGSLAGYTAGLRYHDLESIRLVSRAHGMPVATDRDIRKLIDFYKFGRKDNPWEGIGETKREILRSARTFLGDRVRGQDMAVGAVVDVLKRAAMGLSGVQHSARSRKPRGVLFFAGPTGVGKTEMAKALAQLLFNDEDACVRFDMSEYGFAEADQKLMGAPPGYVGYQAGGQLTNRVRQNPFCVLLFDEIDKADPSILDKFLQILEDGRMTDGRGETVYFSESIIIFTSNVGTYVRSADPRGPREVNIRPYGFICTKCDQYFMEDPHICPSCGTAELQRGETPYPEIRRRILEAIEGEFKVRMGRPELYNRFGNNFIVFDYIRPGVMGEIVEMNLSRVKTDLAERLKIDVEFGPQVVQSLVEQVSGEGEMGARGVGNRIETMIVNPLARYLFDEGVDGNARIIIRRVIETKRNGFSTYSLDVEKG